MRYIKDVGWLETIPTPNLPDITGHFLRRKKE